MSDDRVQKHLADSLDAVHRQNTGRPIRCMCGCRLVFIGPTSAIQYFQHVAQQHPDDR